MEEQTNQQSDKPADPIKEAEAKLAQVESHILDMENAGATDTQKFVGLLQEKMALCNFLKRMNEVNNCEARLRYIEARIRGETPPHATMISMDRERRKKRRMNTNTMLLISVAVFVVIFAAVPFLKQTVEMKKQIAHANTHDEDGMPISGASAVVPLGGPLTDGQVREINTEHPGERIDLDKILKDDETTALYFHSEYCPPCKQMMPQYHRIGARTKNVRFYTIDLDRPGFHHIDFDSPLAAQFDIHRLPYVIIFKGKEKAVEGYDAIDQLNAWSQQNI